MSHTQTLTPQQRRLANEIVASICRGNYSRALKTLDFSSDTLPSGQEQTLRQLLERLQGTRKLDSLLACETLIAELQLQLPALDANAILNMDTHIPRSALSQIYELILTQSFDEFYARLEHIQWVEHTIMRHTLILYEHCTRLKAAQKSLEQLECMFGLKLELCVLYALLLSLSVYLVSFFL